MVAFSKRILLFFIAATLPLPSIAQFACEDIFKPHTIYYNEAVNEALLKSHLQKGKKISPNDLTRLVHNLFDKYEGKEYEMSHYLQMTPAERTQAALLRQISETVTHRGILEAFKKNDLLKDSSSLLTKLWMINRAKSFNIFSTVWATSGLAKGHPPVFLPEVFLEIKPQDMNTLLLKGLDSKEGIEISNRYGFRQEVIRGYSLFNRYYTRIAITVAFILLYDKVDEFLKKGHNSVMSDVWVLFLSELQKYEEEIP